MPELIPLAMALLAAAASAAVVLLLLAWPWRSPNPVRLRLGWVLGAGAGFYVGCGILGQWPRWPALEDRDRLLTILLPLTLAGEIMIALFAKAQWLKWVIRFCLAGIAAPILLYNSIYLADLSGPNSAEWTMAQATMILVALAAALALVWGLLGLLQTRVGDRSIAVVLVLASLAAGLTVMLSSYLKGGKLALPLAGALAGVMLASFAARPLPNSNGVLGVGMIGLFALLVMGRFFGYLPTSTAACLLFAPLLAWFPEIPGLSRLWWGLRAAARPVLVAGVLGLIVMVAFQTFLEKSEANSIPGQPSSDDYKYFKADVNSVPGNPASGAGRPGDNMPASPWNVPPP